MSFCTIIVQLDWPWIAEWAYAGIFALAIRLQNQDQFWISHKKIRGRYYIFFEKSKNEPVRPKMVFLAILAKFRLIFDNSDIEEISQNTSVYRVRKYEFKDLCKKSIDRTSYHLLYFSISIDLD